jgi:hypothetical protein
MTGPGATPDDATRDHATPDPAVGGIDAAVASRYARQGLDNVAREYPNHPAHLLTGPEDLVIPSTLHPIFFGSYDWHSSVHQHWLLVRLLRRFPSLAEAAEVRSWFDEHLTAEAAEVEADYLRQPARRSWERPYGWAWLLTLDAELRTWAADGAPDADRWVAGLTPLVEVVRGRCLDWLAVTPYPQRSGTHANSAFACGLLWDAAVAVGDAELRAAIDAAATRWYATDAGYPAWVEPSAADFLSPVLVTADLRRRQLRPDAFAAWFRRLLPDPGPLLEPAIVVDRTDPQTVHLDGLNLSRAWCWRRIADALAVGGDDAGAALADAAAVRHAETALPHALGGDYVGTHWLPTFGLYLLDVWEQRR